MTRSLIQQCTKCATYTLLEKCPACGSPARNPLPPKYSPEDAYGAYRRKLKKLGPAARGR